MLTAVEVLDEAHRLENELQSDKLMESDALLTTEDENCDAETEVCTRLSQTRRRIWGMWYELSNKHIAKELVDAKRRGLDVLTLRILKTSYFSLSRSESIHKYFCGVARCPLNSDGLHGILEGHRIDFAQSFVSKSDRVARATKRAIESKCDFVTRATERNIESKSDYVTRATAERNVEQEGLRENRKHENIATWERWLSSTRRFALESMAPEMIASPVEIPLCSVSSPTPSGNERRHLKLAARYSSRCPGENGSSHVCSAGNIFMNDHVMTLAQHDCACFVVMETTEHYLPSKCRLP
ncbi:hypothetical protein PC119_g2126 [Phytophthora cactorum]|uniref:Uncharacterized protein n=1 Tax=Phytophthora cactorum TaxID=29920 RepID=A0A8T1EEE7_9STRA|nr:hypothetical protein PC117_g2586 [Phytophthora cactorum]KAG3039507.1 hypothetical protein PC119_g2126 [Phytophthora cactorum]